MIHQSVSVWNENPVITTIESAAYPMKNIQFPTITICQGKKIVFNLKNKLKFVIPIGLGIFQLQMVRRALQYWNYYPIS